MSTLSTTQRKNYTHFFTAVESGDVDEVQFYINTYNLDPMQVYSMDGKMTTPLRTALKRGHTNLVNVLLNSGKVQVSLQDLLCTSKNITTSESFLTKMANNFDKNEMNKICFDNLSSSLKCYAKTNKLPVTTANYNLTEKVLNHINENVRSETESARSYTSVTSNESDVNESVYSSGTDNQED